MCIVLYLSTYAQGQIASEKRIYEDVIVQFNPVSCHYRHFKIVEVVHGFFSVYVAFTSFFRVEKSRLEENGSRGRQLETYNSAKGKSCLNAASVQFGNVGAD